MERLRSENFATSQTIKDTDAHYYPSATGVDVSIAKQAMFFFTLAKTSSPTSIKFTLQISRDNGATWHDYTTSPFDAWIVSASAITASTYDRAWPLEEGKLLGKQMRVKAVGTGTDSSNYFTLTMNAEILDKQV